MCIDLTKATVALALACAIVACVPERPPDTGRPVRATIAFWDTPRRGANLFNRLESAERLQAARALGLDFVRIAPDKWRAAGRDFLIGDADNYERIPPDDLRELIRVLDAADRAGLKVVLTMLSLSGARWRQHNDGEDDGRLWREMEFQTQATRFWRDLARALGGHPAIVGYDILNEPHPGRAAAGVEDAGSPAYLAWWRQSAGTPADLDAFNGRVLTAIREVDPRTPVILESADHASLRAMEHLEPVTDAAVLYSFHFYEPWTYTTWRINRGRYAYPDRMPTTWDGPTAPWSRTRISERFGVVGRWAERHRIPPTRVLLGELGCSRRAPGAADYLADTIDAARARGWHWAFYSFREDTWSDMDYELGPDAHPQALLAAVQAGTRPREPFHDNPLYRMLRTRLRNP